MKLFLILSFILRIFFVGLFLNLNFVTSTLAIEADCNNDYSSLVIVQKSGEILFEKRSDKISYPASLVKMMTLYLTFAALEKHQISLDDILTVSAYGEEIAKVNNNNTLHLKEGDQITVREAIAAVTVKSFNEAAVTLAEAVAGDEWQFVRYMNEEAQKLGMINTSFRNASGLHEEGQYTNSYDLARLALALKKDFPQYYYFFSLKKFSYHGQIYQTHNHILLEYKGAEGMKTGFTKASGFNLISAASQKNIGIISIVLGCPSSQSRDKLTKQLLDISFKKFHQNQRNSHNFKSLNLKEFDYLSNQEDIDRKENLDDQ
ncbi:MAG: D-alanyl-D-alanine carboxypeptidase family protein [Rickettsiales bacterium]|nr:D-alanyl-D-alanine carboxypeptidase family protein [Rickettsiales bacterium]